MVPADGWQLNSLLKLQAEVEVCFHLFSLSHSDTAKHLLILLQTICRVSNER